jgi:hypothetical protein
MNSGCILSATEIQPSDGQNQFIGHDSCSLFRKVINLIGKSASNKMVLPSSTCSAAAAESQLHLVEASTQFPSIPHWQVWTSVSVPAQKYFLSSFLSFHQEYAMSFNSNGAWLHSYYLVKVPK